MNLKKLLFYLIVLVILVGGSFLALKFIFKKEEKQSDSSNSDNPTPNPGGKLTEAELEKYLLEKRLDLQKYFVFNLGRELLKRESEENYNKINECEITSELSKDLNKLTANYGKKMQE